MLPSLSAQDVAVRPRDTDDSQRLRFIKAAQEYLGVPYLSGGTTAQGMDCSGFVYRAAQDGLDAQFPRTVSSLSRHSRIIPDQAREPGDLLFFNTTGRLSHVGIFLGGSTFIHAASDGPRTGVILSDLSEPYWKRTYMYTGRILMQEGLNMPGDSAVPAPLVNPFPFEGGIGFRLNYTGGVLWDFMPGESPLRGASVNAEISWMKNMTVYPGIGAGCTWDTRTRAFSLPVTASLTTIKGFRFFIGTQLHAFAERSLDRTPLFPGILGFSWNSRPIDAFGQKMRFYQSVEYSWFQNETLGTGLRFNTGLTISCDI